MVAIDNMVENIRYKSQILARTNKMDSASSPQTASSRLSRGCSCAVILIVVPALLI